MLRHTTTIALVTLAAGLSARAQFSSGVNLVEVYASVTDERGEPVKGLTRQDFDVRENGEPQTLSTFSAGDFPLTVALAIDRSFSMAGARLAAAKSGARAFLEELRPEDEVTLLGIGSEVDVLAPLSTDRQAQYTALDKIDAFGTTGLHDAIIRAIEVTQEGKGRRALVILSDGNDRFSTASADTALARARASDVMVYPIALGGTRPPLFAELATLTGGRSYQLKDPGRLAETLRALARELRSQYLLGYTPVRALVAGSNEWRSISVSVRDQRYRVRARDGYQVK